MLENNQHIHLLMRYSDKSRKINTIAEHIAILEELGYVWFGKFGLGASMKMVELINEQCRSSIETLLFLVAGREITHQAKIKAVEGTKEQRPFRQQDTQAVPPYYRREACALWVKIENLKPIQHNDVIRHLALFKSSMPVRPDLTSSRALIYVRRVMGGCVPLSK